MATPFSRTVRSLDYESSNSYILLLGMLAILLLTLMWGYWFFTAPILSYENSREVSMTNEEETISRVPQEGVGAVRPQLVQRRIIVAKFPAKAIKTIQPGQSALLRFESKGKPLGAIPATVLEVIDSPGTGSVKLYTETEVTKPNPLEQAENLEVIIEVGNAVPSDLVLHASGLFTDSPPLSISPSPR